MPAHLTFTAIPVQTDSTDRDGVLVLADGLLVAILVRLSSRAHEPILRGTWFMEAGFGHLAGPEQPTFASLDAAGEWLGKRLAEREPRTAQRAAS